MIRYHGLGPQSSMMPAFPQKNPIRKPDRGQYKAVWMNKVAEREGFEPSVEVSPYTRLAGARLQPTRPSLRKRLSGGGSRIRTHGAVTLNGFQDRRYRPLSHPSGH